MIRISFIEDGRYLYDKKITIRHDIDVYIYGEYASLTLLIGDKNVCAVRKTTAYQMPSELSVVCVGKHCLKLDIGNMIYASKGLTSKYTANTQKVAQTRYNEYIKFNHFTHKYTYIYILYFLHHVFFLSFRQKINVVHIFWGHFPLKFILITQKTLLLCSHVYPSNTHTHIYIHTLKVV